MLASHRSFEFVKHYSGEKVSILLEFQDITNAECSGVTRILRVVGLIAARLDNFCLLRCLPRSMNPTSDSSTWVFLQNYWDLLFVDRAKSFYGRTE
jgi:hypothetical protein